jgi:hypothetical protein
MVRSILSRRFEQSDASLHGSSKLEIAPGRILVVATLVLDSDLVVPDGEKGRRKEELSPEV